MERGTFIMNLIKRMPRGGKFRAIVAAAIAAGGAAIAVPAVAASASAVSSASTASSGSAVSLGSAASSGSTAAPAATPPPCATSQLRVWLGVPGDGSAGHVAYQLEFSNISARTCTLFGYPGVSAVRGGGVQLGSAAARDAADPRKVVTLARGATAHALLVTANTSVFPATACHQSTAIGLKVFPPNTTSPAFIGFPIPACAKAGPVFLRVRTVVAGTGIPAFST
jgi:hypothetical protein